MNILHIAFYTFKRSTINTKFFTVMILLPLLLIPILGVSLKATFNDSDFQTIKIGVYSDRNEDFDEFNKFIKSQDYKKNISLEKISSIDKGIIEVKNANKVAFICIKTLQDSKKEISTYVYRKDNFESSVIENVINSYKNKDISSTELRHLNKIVVDTVGKSPRAIDYYAVTMVVMIILYASHGCILLLNEDFYTDVKNRVKSLPIDNMKIILGKIIGYTFSVFVRVMIVIIITKFVYRVNWGSNFIFISLAILFYCFLSVNLGVSIFFVIKNSDVAIYIIEIIAPIFTFLSGGYLQLNYLGDNLEKLSGLSPSFAIQNIIFNSIYVGYCENVNKYSIQLMMLSLITVVIIIVFGRKMAK